MTESEALAEIRGLAGAGRVEFTDHALEEMEAAGADFQDVMNALREATGCRYQSKNDRWKVRGPDGDGEDLTVVVFLESGILVVTVW